MNKDNEIPISNTEDRSFEIKIDKEYFIVEFRLVFDKWQYELGVGMNIYKEEEFFNDLIDTIDRANKDLLL